MLTMKFQAADLVALRSLVNSYLRLVALWKRLSDRLDRPPRDKGNMSIRHSNLCLQSKKALSEA